MFIATLSEFSLILTSKVIRLDLGGRRGKDRIRAQNVTAFIPENSAYKHASSVESVSLVVGGSQ